MEYDSLLATEHVARYVFAAQLARGCRVLDIACGEGYGSAMIIDAGADQVLGVDISPTAIAIARERFAREGLTFRIGAAEELPTVVGADILFDLIVSFETIEHVEDVGRFLGGVRQVLKPGGSIVMSAPNEGCVDNRSKNPFHRRTYDLRRFRADTEAILGPARAMLFGMPLQGFAVVDPESGLPGNDASQLDVALESETVGSGRLLAAQRYHRVGERQASFFVGVWGGDVASVIAAAPIAEAARKEMYDAVNWLRAENARLLRLRAERSEAAFHGEREPRLHDVIVDLRRAELLDRQRLEKVTADLARAEADLAFVREERDRERQLVVSDAMQAEERHRTGEAALCARLRCAEEQLTLIRSSKFWRMQQLYIRVYDVPVIGVPLRLLRRTAGRAWRLLYRRRPATGSTTAASSQTDALDGSYVSGARTQLSAEVSYDPESSPADGGSEPRLDFPR